MLAGSLREKTENNKKTWNWIENIIYWWKRNEYSNLTKEEMEKLEELKEKYLKKFEELDKCGLDYWETPEVLSGSTGTTVSDVEFVIKHTHDFVKNSKGKITTKKNYLKKEPILKRINDTLNGNIS